MANILLVLFATHSLISAQSIQDIEVRKIWDQAPHSAFTDLIHFKDYFYCSFREGSSHVPGTDGTVRILRSKDGQNWESIADLKKEGIDLRDPKLSITPKGQIMVVIGGSLYKEGKLLGRIPQVSFSNTSGTNFSKPEKIEIDKSIVSWGDWIWRVTWHKGTGYAIDYQIGPEERRGPTAMYLVSTKDGKSFKKVSKIELDGFPNEATVRFDKKGTLYAMIRRETGDQKGVWAKAEFPYTRWDYKKMDYRLGGPNFIFLDDTHLVAGTRMHEESVYTGLLVGDKTGQFQKLAKLPSTGDSSYPGLLIHNGKLWVSYYSTHEGKSSIYISQIPLSDVEKAFE